MTAGHYFTKKFALRLLRNRLLRNIVGAGLLTLATTGCREEILHNVSEYEANRLLTSLQTLSIDAAKERQADGSWVISVPGGDSFRAIKFASESRLVREPLAAITNKSSLVMSRDEQRFAYERSLSREIETTLISVPGVLEARVHLNIPASDPLLDRRRDDAHGTASVLLLIESQRLVMREEIATLVAGASGVPIQFVSVVVAEEARSGVPTENIRPVAGAPGREYADLPVPLFTHEIKPNPAEVITDLAITEHYSVNAGFWQSVVAGARGFLANVSIVRCGVFAGVGTLLIGLYLYARRRSRGTGIPLTKS